MSDLFQTVEDVLHEMDGATPEPPPQVEPFVPTVLPNTPELPPPGIYFGMDESTYHALPALSNSGIKRLLASPMLFWADTPWLNAKKREEMAESSADEKIHRVLGRAYHCRIMEGSEVYHSRFAVDLSPEECEGALDGVDQIKAAIKAKGASPVAKVMDTHPTAGEYPRVAKKSDWIAQLLELDPAARILDVLKTQHREKHADKTFVSRDSYERIEIAAKMVEADPQVRHAFRGGYPEVVLIWHCPDTGVPMKARVDYLKRDVIVDLKSIANQRERSMENAIRYEIAAYKYHLQPCIYAEGVREVRKIAAKDGRRAIHLHDESGDDDIAAFVLKWAARTDDPQWLWVFQQKGDAPITRACSYPLAGTTNTVTAYQVLEAKRQFIEFSRTFGCDPWLDVKPIYDLADEDLPPSTCEF
jgi:hypothetical protein